MQVCDEHDKLIKSVDRLMDKIDIVVDNLTELKIQMVARNAYLKGIKRGVQLAAGVLTCIGASKFGVNLDNVEKLLKLFSS